MGIKSYTLLLGILFACISLVTSVQAQDNLVVEYNGASGVPTFLNICGEPDTARMTVRITGLEIDSRENIEATLNLFQGAQFVELISAQSDAGVSLLSFGLSTATFSIPDLDPFITSEINLVFSLKADCSFIDTISANNQALVFDTWDLSYDQDGSSLTESELIAEYKDAFAVPNLTISNTNNVTITSIGECFDRDIILSNSGLSGFIDSLNYETTYGPGITVNSITINGIDFPLTKTAVGLDTLYEAIIVGVFMEQNTLGQGLGDGDQSLDPDESLIITENVCVLSCDADRSSIHNVSWGCYGAACEGETITNFVTIGSGAPNPVQSNVGSTPNENTGYCKDGLQTITFTNSGNEVDLGYGTMRDVELGIGLGNDFVLSVDKYEIFSVTVAGITLITTDSLIKLDQFVEFAVPPSDPTGMNGPDGLIDWDNDGFYDDLPINESVEISVGYRFLCSEANSTEDNCENTASVGLASQVFYSNSCAERLVLVNNSVIRPSNIAPNSESSTDTDATIEDGTFHIQYFQLRTVSNFDKACSGGERLIVTVDLPTGITIDLSETNLFRNGTIAHPLVSSTMNGTIIELVYDASISSFIGGEFTIDLGLIADCTASIGAISFPITFAHYCPDCDCTHTWFCGDLDGPILHPNFDVCNNAPPCPNGVRALDFDVSRTTFGYTDETYTDKVDVGDANLKVALSCDSVMMTIESIVGDDNITNDVGVIITYDNPEALPGLDEIFLFDGAEVEIRQTNGNIDFCTVAASAMTVTATGINKHLDIELDDCLAALGLTLTPNDTIIFRGMFSLNPDGPYNEQFKLVPNFRGEVYHTFAGNQLSCDNYGTAFTVANTGSLFVPAQFPTFPMGCDAGELEYKVVVYNNDFGIYYPNEFIPAAFTDSISFSFDLAILDAFEDLSVEVSIPNHPIHGNNFFEIAGLDAFPNGEYLATFDTLTSIPSYNTVFSSVFTLRVNLIANCGSEIASSDGDNLFDFTPTIYYRDRIYAESFGDGSCASYIEESINNNILYTEAPEFSLQALSNPNPQVMGNEVQWVIQHCNISTESDVGLNWLALDITNESINIELIQDNSTGTLVDVPFISYGNNNSVFAYVDPLLQNFSGNSPSDICNTYIITASFNECGAFPLTVRTGWNCTAYDEPDWTPLDYAPCNEDTLNLTVATLEGALDAEVLVQPGDQIGTATVDLCDTLVYEILVRNTDLGDVFQMENQFFLPLDGMAFVPNSFELAYPSSSIFVPISDPMLEGITSRGELHVFNDFSQISPFLEANGLQGFNPSMPIDSNEYVIRFELVSGCNFVSGDQLSYSFQGVSACGDSTNIEFGETLPIFIQDVPEATQFFLAEFGSTSTYDISGNGTLDVSVSNITGTPSDDNDVIRIILPLGTTYTPGSAVVNTPATWIAGEPEIVIEDGFFVLYWDMPQGVAQGETINFSFDFTGDPIPQCSSDTLEFNLFTGDRYETECGSTGEICSVYVGTTEGGEQILDLIITNGISIGINNAVSICINNNTEEVTVTAEITGLPILTQNGDVIFYFDTDMNGEADPAIDILLSTSTIPIGTVDNFNVNETFNVTNAQLCNIIMAVEIDIFDLGNCEPPTPVSISPVLQNAGISTNYCGSPLTIGDDDCGNTYTYQWTAIAPATNADISDVNILNPVLIVDPAIAVGTTLQYILETTRDGCGYVSLDTIGVTILADLTVTITPDGSTTVCEGESLLLTSAASETVSHQWSDGTNNLGTNPTLTVTPITATTYIVVVTNNSGCTAMTSIDITIGTGVTTIDAGNAATICLGTSTQLQGTSTGGNGTLSYSWTGADLDNSNIANPTATPTVTTTYTLEVTDEDGCIQSDDVIITVDPDVPMAAADDPTLCVGLTTVLNAAGGNNYTWTEMPGNPSINTLSATNIATPTFTPTIEGTYNFEVLVEGGCDDVTVPVTVEVTSIQVITPQIDLDQCDGDVQPVSITLEENIQSYIINGGPFQNDASNGATLTFDAIYNQGANSYSIELTGVSGCTVTTTFNFIECPCNPAMIQGVLVANSNCGESTGSATINISGNPADYTFTWSPNTGTATGNGESREDLLAGTYEVTIEEILNPGCIVTTTVVIGNSDAPTPTSVVTTPATCNNNDGTATILPANWIYDWSDSGTGNVRTDLTSGIYGVTVTDDVLCTNVIMVIILEDNDLMVSHNVITDPTCGNDDGSVEIIVAGGGNYTFIWSDGGTGAIRNNLSSGTYVVNIEEIGGDECSTTYILALTDSDVPQAPVTINEVIDILCVDDANGSVDFTVALPAGITNPVDTIITDGFTEWINGTLVAGQYCIEIRDANGCVNGAACFEIGAPTPIMANISISAACGVGGSVTITTTGGTGTYTYDWSDLVGTNNPKDRTNLIAGNYELSISDSNGCQMVLDGGITIPDCPCDIEPEIESVVIVEATCGNSDGEATIIVNPTSAGLDYTWFPDLGTAVGDGNIRIGLPAGGYNVTVSDAIGECFDIVTFAVNNEDGPELDAPIMTTSADCGTANGIATLSPATFNYVWSDGETGSTRTDLESGIYFVSISEVGNPTCFSVEEIFIGQNNDLVVTVNTVIAPTCGNADGTAMATTNGSGAYNYEWSFGGTTSDTQSNLIAGVYGVTATDAASPDCEATTTFLLIDGDVVGADVVINSVSDVSCGGKSDGMVNFIVSPQAGFQGPETVVIANANGEFGNGSLAGGDYCIVVYDANGCVAGGDCFTIEENEPLDAEFSISGGCGIDGSIDINITQGSGTYTFDWADLPGTNDPEDRDNLTIGMYSVTITDADGCTITGVDLEIECDECTLDLDLESVVIQEATCGENDGEATVNANVDLEALVFTWTPNLGISGATDNIRTDLPAGGYIVVATDTTGFCSDSISFVINNEDAPELDAEPVIVSADCGTANGALTLSPNTYDYIWSDNETGAVRTNLSVGIYFVTFTDPATPNCEGIVEVIVLINNTLEVTIDIINAPTCGNVDGEILANVTNGSGNYTYSWNTEGTTINQSGIISGTYTVEVTDLDNPECTATATIVLLDSDVTTNYVVTINTITNVSCAGEADGSVDFDVTPNTGFTTIIVGNGITYTNGTLPGGDYCINVIDATGCIAGEECFTILESAPLEVEFSITEGCQDAGSIDLIITGGTGNYTFDWADLVGTNDPEDRTDLAVGTYSVSISDENGCLLEGIDLEVVCTDCNFEPVVTSTVIFEATCGNSDGEVTININVDPSLPIYTWLPNVGTPGITGNIRTDLPAGGYTVTVADSTGICFDIVTFAITNEDGPELDNEPITTSADCDVANGTATLSPNTYDYTWSDLGTGATRTDLAAGVYFVTFTDAAEPDCEGVVEVIIGINSILEVEIEVIVSPTCGNADGEIAANVTNGSGNYQYTWSFGGSNMTESALESDSYAVTVTDIDNPNCTASASIVLIDGDVANIDVIINGVTDITCLGANDGFVDFTANVPAGFNVIITDGINIYENGSLPVGELCIEITDASDCVAGGICFEIEEPTELDVEFSISGGCAEDGAINIITNGGTGNYTFDWLDLPGDDNIEDRTNLSTGIYSVIVSDENECAVVGLDLAIECEECEDPIIDYTIAFESVCGGFIGSAEVVVNGNITDYTYDWTPAAVGTVSADGNKLTQLPAGLYQVVVADIGNLACIDSVSILVTNEDGPEATIELVTPAGCDDSDGTATLAPDSLTYEWSDGGVGAIRDDLAAGIYEVIYYDDEDTICYNVLLVEISDTSNLELEVEIISLPDCNMNNGEVMINLLSVMGELVFIWSDGGSGQNRDDLEAGTYTVIALEEASGCSTEITFTLLNNVAETATINITEIINISCNGDGLGSIIFDVTYDAAFVQPAVVTVTDGFTAYDPNNLPVGNYCINVEDANKCLVASECFEITETEELVLSIVGTYAGCEGSDELGSFDVTVTGGTMPYSFDWADLTDPNEPEDRTDLSAGIYDLTVTDALGCMIIANNIGLDTFCITDCEYFNGIDTLNMEITCGDTLEVCTDLSYGDFLLGEYSISLDGVLYDATTEDVCEADLFYFYPLTSLSPGNGLIGPYVAEWDIDGNIINIGEFLTLSDLVDSMNVLDLGGNWILDQSLAGSAVGGNTGAIYGNLTITVANNPSDSNTIIVGTLQNALNISIGIAGEGQHEVIIINNETLCPDTLIVNLACKGYVLYDTMTLGDSIYYCLDIVELIDSTDLMGNIVSLENVCPDESGTSVIFNIESEVPPCISYLGITPGTDTACLVLCDDLGICDTVNYIVTVIPTGPIIVTDTVLVMEQDTFCLDSLTNLCGDIVSVTDFCNDGGMIVDFDIIQTDDDFCITYEGLNIGVDSACLEVIDIYGNADTVIIIITVATTTPDTICDTIFIGQIVEYCIDASELLTAPETLINICEDQSGEFVEFFADENTYCVTYEGVADVGTDSACIVICDSVGVCDTTYFCITVVEFFDPPIAVDDYDTTLTNIPIVINVKENDTIFGGIDSIYVIDGPLVGDVILNLDCTFTYTPDEGVCSITDSFTYVVCNPNACDTATVFIYIQCTDLTIFNGFSPNNDGVNDVFYIDGIEDFPNNRLCVYNRWGNKVYDKKGYNNEWFGTWTGNDLPDGTYFYVLDLGAENEGKPTIYNGYIQIHR